jgi:Tol biopolymer transport system component
MAKVNHVRTSATLAAILVAILLAAPVVMVPANASRGDAPSIAFTSDRKATADSAFNVYRMEADGRGPTERLTDIPGNNVMPAYSPDGSGIAYVRSGATGIPAIYRMNADGSNETSLVSDLSFNTDPSWFPGGRSIAFSRNEDIYMMTLAADGAATKSIRLTRNASADRQPTVSPDGSRIAFVSNRDGDFDVYVMKVAPESSTNRPVKLTKNTAPDFAPDWSPIGGKIAFSTGAVGAQEICAMKAVPQNGDTNPPINLTRDAADDSDPDWSPDGKQIAFTSDRTSNDEIWRMEADGSAPDNLTNSPASEDLQPDWSPRP